MKAGAAFARVGAFPKDAAPLGVALSLFEQRAAAKFDAIDRNPGDVVGDWVTLDVASFTPSTIGNGAFRGRWRPVGRQAVGLQYFCQVGTTTVFSPFGFFAKAPPGYAVELDAGLFDRVGSSVVPVSVAGIIGGAVRGGTVAGLISKGNDRIVVAGALPAVPAAGDAFMFVLEMPVRKVGT